MDAKHIDGYRFQRSCENQQKNIYPGVGPYDIPPIPAFTEDITATNWISFNMAKTCDEPQDHSLHFFIDDYQFQRLWVRPDQYTPMLARFKYVCSPDFSLYTDFPRALQIYNHWRKHWLAAYWTELGIKVVPTICWSDEASFDWCFDGEPEDSVVAISSNGCLARTDITAGFIRGYTEMMARLKPRQVLFYGEIPPGLPDSNIYQIKSFIFTRLRRIDGRT